MNKDDISQLEMLTDCKFSCIHKYPNSSDISYIFTNQSNNLFFGLKFCDKDIIEVTVIYNECELTNFYNIIDFKSLYLDIYYQLSRVGYKSELTLYLGELDNDIIYC